MKNRNKNSARVLNIIKTILFSLFALIAVASISYSIVEKKNNNGRGVSFFNHEAMIVLTDSMGKCDETDVSEYKIKSIPVRSMVFIEDVPEEEDKAYTWYSNIEKGDVLTFKYMFDRQVTITHRVIDITPIDNGESKGFVFNLMGDNKVSGSNPGVQVVDTTDENSYNFIIGKVTGQSIVLGNVVSFLKSKVGIATVIVLPALALLIYEIVKITRILGEEKKEKVVTINSQLESTNDAQKEEIEALKRELERLKQEQKINEIESVNKEETK